jgi:hypothetical protein
MSAIGETPLDPLAKEILLAAAADRGGTIKVIEALGPTFVVRSSGQEWKADKDPRLQADLEAAIRQLVSLGLIEDKGYEGQVYKMTQRGYQTADSLK